MTPTEAFVIGACTGALFTATLVLAVVYVRVWKWSGGK